MNKVVRVPVGVEMLHADAHQLGEDSEYAYFAVPCNCEAWLERFCASCRTLPDTAEKLSEGPRAEERFFALPEHVLPLVLRSRVMRGPGLSPEPVQSPKGTGKVPDLAYRAEDAPAALRDALWRFRDGKVKRMPVPMSDVRPTDVVAEAVVLPVRFQGDR